jgi:hypothetical protein
MSTKLKVEYLVNGVAVSLWKRLAGTKTFWVAAVFVLGAAEMWNRGEIPFSTFWSTVQTGVIGILIRAALYKAELASNAANPDVVSVDIHEKEVPKSGGISGMFLAMLIVGSTAFFAGCADKQILASATACRDGICVTYDPTNGAVVTGQIPLRKTLEK